jgi:hypothetical protein
VTGVKRDIELLARTPAAAGDSVTVFDISLTAKRAPLLALLERGVRVEYFDHHHAGTIPDHPLLSATIDTSPAVCTGALVDRRLGGRFRRWAVVAACGDNLLGLAHELADACGLDAASFARLRELGDTLVYASYGDDEDDLVVHPTGLYQAMHPYADPLEFIRAEPMYREIDASREEDVRLAARAQPEVALAGAIVYILPDAAWSRRTRGLFANQLANVSPHLAHAVLTPNRSGGYTASVRAPLDRERGADLLCLQFATGGGRAGAAGINDLPHERLGDFVRALDRAYPAPATGTAP